MSKRGKTIKKLILFEDIDDMYRKIILVLEQEDCDFETVDINALVCYGYNSSSNILVVPESLYTILDKCMEDKINSSKMDTILTCSDLYNSVERKKEFKNLNILGCINIGSSSDEIKNVLLKFIK